MRSDKVLILTLPKHIRMSTFIQNTQITFLTKNLSLEMIGVREGFNLYNHSFVLFNNLDLLNQLLDELQKDGKKCVSMHTQDHGINWAT